MTCLPVPDGTRQGHPEPSIVPRHEMAGALACRLLPARNDVVAPRHGVPASQARSLPRFHGLRRLRTPPVRDLRTPDRLHRTLPDSGPSDDGILLPVSTDRSEARHSRQETAPR
jgi:hypothetical protein